VPLTSENNPRRRRKSVGGLRICVGFFQESGFDAPQFFGRFQSAWSLLTIDGQNRTCDSEYEQNGDFLKSSSAAFRFSELLRV